MARHYARKNHECDKENRPRCHITVGIMSENREELKEEKKTVTGTVEGVNGPVVDVQFERSELPKIREELYVELPDGRRNMEVAQHISRGMVRCIMLGPSEGLHRGMKCIATGAPVSVPVGECVLGRLFDALGNTRPV